MKVDFGLILDCLGLDPVPGGHRISFFKGAAHCLTLRSAGSGPCGAAAPPPLLLLFFFLFFLPLLPLLPLFFLSPLLLLTPTPAQCWPT